MLRSILAVFAGFAVFMLFGIAMRATWSEQSESNLTLFGAIAGWLASGYVTALICRRAYITHTFVAFVLCAGIPAIIGHFTGIHRDWMRWDVGLSNAAIAFTWCGFFRNWQVSHRRLPPNEGNAPNGAPTAALGSSAVAEGPPSVS
jgi:hypothetical protein